MSQLPPSIPDELSVDKAQSQLKVVGGAESRPGERVSNEEPILSLRTLRAQVEIKAIKSALKRTGWNRKQAARLLKISYRGLLYKIHRHHIQPSTETS
jgi:two-component system response regulator AtoC